MYNSCEVDTICDIAGESIRIQLKPRLVSITNDGALKRLVGIEPRQHTHALVVALRQAYQAWSGTELHISDNSLKTEIWGHLVAERIALSLRKAVNTALTRRFARFVMEHMELIDCGERAVDHNRFIWDMTVPAAWLFRWLLPRPRA